MKSGINTRTQELVAIKIIMKKGDLWEKNRVNLTREIEILKVLRHPRIIEYKRVYEGKEHVYIVLALAGGGELFEKLRKDGPV